MVAHSRFGGSSAARWLNCSGSIGLLAKVPVKPSSKYADEGSAAHELAARCLKADLHPTHFLGETFPDWPDWPVTQEMCDAVVKYLNVVTHEAATDPANAQLFVEHGFTLDIVTAATGEVFGTNDALVYHAKSGRLVVFDYKHGAGVSVSAEDNAQLKFYALGAVFAQEWGVSEIILKIVQPRARDADEIGIVREWTFDTLDLLEFKQEITAAIWDADKEPKFKAGGWCDKTWCDARSACPAYQAMQLKDTGFETIDLAEVNAADLPEPKDLTPERLSAIVAGASRLQAWMNQAQEYLEALLLGGTAVPGWKVVEKLGRAKWIADDEEIAATLAAVYGISEDLVRPRKLTTLGDVEKLMKQAGAAKAEIEAFKAKNTIKESSGLTIAADTDRRPAIDAAKRAFGDVAL